MLTCFKPSYLFNKTINDYCRHSTNESIKKITDRYNLERKKVQFKDIFNDEHEDKKDKDNHTTCIYIFSLLSISTLAFFLYKRLK
jgi:hypothetical protein